jgi:hypothetical protein
MTSTISPPSPLARRSTRRKTAASGRVDRARVPRARSPLGHYTDSQGSLREIVALPGSFRSVLVVDRDAATLSDRRLVAHLDADEPMTNAALVCSRYLEGVRGDCRRCRHVTPEDFRTSPFAVRVETDRSRSGRRIASVSSETLFLDERARSYRLELLLRRTSIPELRWRRYPPREADGEPLSHRYPQPVSVREAVACLESYEPVCSLTRRALVLCHDDPAVSTAVLRSELERVRESPIVLNRKLRQAVLVAVEREELSMSEIAIRCGRIKRDSRGNESGETSWLARRLGILPEGGGDRRTPWIHSDVLALIARCGLGISPREVELG